MPKAIHPRKAARLGIGRAFQHNPLFRRLSVREDVPAGLSRNGNASFYGMARPPLRHRARMPVLETEKDEP